MDLIAGVARACSPFLMAPAIGVAAVIVFAFNPHYRRVSFLIFASGLMIAAILGPFVLEQLGALSHTTTFTGDGLVLHTRVLAAGPATGFTILIAFTLTLITTATWLGYSLRVSEQAARRQVHLQAWHLRQLVRGAPVPSS